jgi:hypothetical protein
VLLVEPRYDRVDLTDSEIVPESKICGLSFGPSERSQWIGSPPITVAIPSIVSAERVIAA